MIDRQSTAKSLVAFFDSVMENPVELDIVDLVKTVESIIPVHTSLNIESFDDIDSLLALYPLIYQKMTLVFAWYVQAVRTAVGRGDKKRADVVRSYRDAFEELMRTVKFQYEALSRRITIWTDRRA